MLKTSKGRMILIASVVGVILVAIISGLLWFNNRKFDVSFDENNGAKTKIVQVKYNKVINEKSIKNKDDLGESFIGWYEIIEVKDGKDVLAEKPFDFKTKIVKNIKLKAVYSEKVETITIKFDSKGGSKVDDIILNKGVELTLPKDPTYSGYTFKCWEDKNETPIYNNALLDEDTILYAKWEKVEEKKKEAKKTQQPKKDSKKETKKEEPKKEEPKEVVYYCEDGYKLEGTKCTKTISKTAEIVKSCSSPYNLAVGNKCVNINDKKPLVRACKEYNGYDWDIVPNAPVCYYNKMSHGNSLEDCRRQHPKASEVRYYKGMCYLLQKGADYVIYSCPAGYTSFRPTQTSNPVCGKSVDAKKTYSCESGYRLAGKNCLKEIVVDAKKK